MNKRKVLATAGIAALAVSVLQLLKADEVTTNDQASAPTTSVPSIATSCPNSSKLKRLENKPALQSSGYRSKAVANREQLPTRLRANQRPSRC